MSAIKTTLCGLLATGALGAALPHVLVPRQDAPVADALPWSVEALSRTCNVASPISCTWDFTIHDPNTMLDTWCSFVTDGQQSGNANTGRHISTYNNPCGQYAVSHGWTNAGIIGNGGQVVSVCDYTAEQMIYLNFAEFDLLQSDPNDEPESPPVQISQTATAVLQLPSDAAQPAPLVVTSSWNWSQVTAMYTTDLPSATP